MLLSSPAAAANPNSQPELAAGTLSPEALAKAKELVGFEEADGLIEAYVSQLTAPEAPAEP
jgi:hypothetical protein